LATSCGTKRWWSLRGHGAGATVLRGILGFDADGCLHTAKILRLSEDLPIVVETVDRPERTEALLTEIDPMICEGLITREKARVIAYRAGTNADSA